MLQGLPPWRINRLGIGRTFQDLRLVKALTVKENIVLAMNGRSGKARGERAQAIIASCLPEGLDNLPAGQISYGQQKLLTLACCMANDAGCLLLDEPVAGIAASYHDVIARLLNQWRTAGKTILMIEHHTGFVSDVADEVFILQEGQLTPC